MRLALFLVVMAMLIVIGIGLGLWASEKLEYIETTRRWRRVVAPIAVALGVAALIIATGGV